MITARYAQKVVVRIVVVLVLIILAVIVISASTPAIAARTDARRTMHKAPPNPKPV